MNNAIKIDIPKNFTIEEAGKFRMQVNRLMESGEKNFIFNFSECDFIDSTGLGVMVAVYKKCVERSGSIKLKGVKDQVRKIFKLTRLDKVFEISS